MKSNVVMDLWKMCTDGNWGFRNRTDRFKSAPPLESLCASLNNYFISYRVDISTRILVVIWYLKTNLEMIISIVWFATLLALNIFSLYYSTLIDMKRIVDLKKEHFYPYKFLIYHLFKNRNFFSLFLKRNYKRFRLLLDAYFVIWW